MTTSSISELPSFTLGCTLPIRLVSEANMASHAHWRVRAGRAKAQRAAVALGLMGRLAPLLTAREVRTSGGLVQRVCRSIGRDTTVEVTITRIAPRELDSDNLAGSAKHVRDAIAELLAIDDRDRRVNWIVLQEKGKPKEYATGFWVKAWFSRKGL